MKQVNYKYRILEAKHVLNNKDTYPKMSVQKAQQLIDEYVPATYTPLTDEQRAEIKRKYPNTYK